MMNWLPFLGALACVAGMLAFLVYCNKQIDAEDEKVKRGGQR